MTHATTGTGGITCAAYSDSEASSLQKLYTALPPVKRSLGRRTTIGHAFHQAALLFRQTNFFEPTVCSITPVSLEDHEC